MIEIKLRLVATLCLILVVSGCGNLGFNSEKKPAVETGGNTSKTQTFVAQVGLSPRQRFSKSLQYLENGNEGQALAELEAYLLEVPKSSSAKRLIEQIKTDPTEYFPKEHFNVELTSGVSLSDLAKKYLGSAHKFYALAKYNNISNPSRVNIGQKIKIPATQLARMVRDKDKVKADQELAAIEAAAEAEARGDAEMDEEMDAEMDTDDVEAEVNEGMAEVEDAMDEDTSVIEEDVPEVEIVVTAESLTEDIKSLHESGDFAQALSKLEELKKFGELGSENEAMQHSTWIGYAEQIKEEDPIEASKYYYKVAEVKLKNEDQFAAFKNFKQASELDEDNIAAMEEMLVLQKDISDKYHREASTAFRRQELDSAIASWDKVLAVNPEHTNAQLQRAQAIELKKRIEELNKN